MSHNNLSDLETRVKNSKPAGLTDHEKEYAWSKIEAGLTAPVPKFSYLTLFKRAQSRFVAGMVGLLILGGGAATAYAHNAKPGDFLFPVEIVKEKTQIFLAGSEKKREVLHIKFAEKRLAEVRELTALAAVVQNQSTASTTVATSTGAGVASTTAPAPALSKNDMKKIARAEHAITIALDELLKTRNKLATAGNVNAAFVIDDIIEELKGVGDGTITITRIAAKGGDDNGRVSLRATINASSSASSTFSGTVRIEEKKNRTTITLKNDDMKTEVTLKNSENKHGNENEGKREKDNHDNDRDKHDDDRDKHDDDDEDEDDHDGDNRGRNSGKGRGHDDDDDKKGGKKITICHTSGTARQSLSIAVAAARAHIAHGDTLGVCATTTTPPASDTSAPTLTSITALPIATSATISWNTNEDATARVWLSTTSPVSTINTPTQERTTFALSHSFSLSGLASGTTYFYILSSSDAAGNRATSSQGSFTTIAAGDTTAPIVSGTNVTTNTTSATLSFTTDENAKARVWISSSSPVATDGSPDIDESSFASTHSASLSGLIPNTLYHYIISVVDAAGNRATTSDATFTTTAPADTVAPVISAASVATTTSSATISWTTGESTNGAVYFSQTTPVNTGTASSVEVNVFATTHSALLSGLTASTTYHYLIVARDNAGNSATSSEHSFTLE
jgi:hypothetical protein